MNVKLHIDLESFSECDLSAAGVYRYAEHPSTEVLCFSYKFSDEKAIWSWRPGDPLPARVVAHIQSKGQLRAHNAQFERVVLNGVAGEKIGFPKISIEQTVCTAAKMAAHGIPRALGQAAEALGASPKSIEGKIVMLQLCKPQKRHAEGRYTPANAPEKFAILYKYCAGDVQAEADIDARVPDLSPAEQRVYVLDQYINQRGIAVDLEAIASIKAVIEQYKAFLEAEMLKLVGVAPTQRAKIADWIRTTPDGYPGLQDMQSETVKQLSKNPNVSAKVKRVLAIYNTYNMKAVAKYDAILDAVCADGRIRGMFLFLGANTGRWSSLIVQLQNLFRPVIDDPDTAIAAFGARDLDWIRSLYSVDPMKVAASCVRGMLIAGPERDLLFPDFVGIESRGNAWLFDEEWKLEVFRAQDAKTGPDSYKVAYARAFQIAVGLVTKPQRQIGKVMELALGYEGGVGAFVTMVATYGIDLKEMTKAVLPIIPQDVRESADWMWHKMPQTRNDLDYDTFIACDSLKRLWRMNHPRIVQGWKDLKDAAEMAVQHPGKVFEIPNGKIKFKVQGDWLFMRLPSGRRLAYYKPSWKPPETVAVKAPDGVGYVQKIIPGEMRYWGIDTYTRQWKELTTYGGKLCENAVQALCRDLLVYAMFKLEAAGYPLVGTVHDELITEILKTFGSLEAAYAIICDGPDWAKGLPLAAEGHRQPRYRK